MLLETLAPRHEITLVALAWNATDRAALAAWQARGLAIRAIPHGRAVQVRNLRGDPRRPLQQIVATSPALARAVRALLAEAAAGQRPFDAIHVEHLRGASALQLGPALGARTILDAVDCIAELARLTQRHNPGRLARLLATIDEGRTRRLEAFFTAAADVTTVVADRDREALIEGGAGGRIVVVPNGVPRFERPGELTRDPVAIFTGKLSYHANQAALRLLLGAIWPRVRALLPTARLIVAGAEPPGWLRRAAGRDGVSLHGDVAEMLPLIARARVALAPTVYGVGIQNKVLEAMACGVPVVATPSAVEGLLPAARGCALIAADPASFAGHVARIMADDQLAAGVGEAGRAYVRAWHDWERTAAYFEMLYAGGAPPAAMPVPGASVRVA